MSTNFVTCMVLQILVPNLINNLMTKMINLEIIRLFTELLKRSIDLFHDSLDNQFFAFRKRQKVLKVKENYKPCGKQVEKHTKLSLLRTTFEPSSSSKFPNSVKHLT